VINPSINMECYLVNQLLSTAIGNKTSKVLSNNYGMLLGETYRRLLLLAIKLQRYFPITLQTKQFLEHLVV